MGRARRAKAERRWERSVQGEAAARALGHLDLQEQSHGRGIWARLEALRAARLVDGRPPWPEWCWGPLELARQALAYEDLAEPYAERRAARLAGLWAWRQTKGIYHFDPDFLGALADTDFDERLPGQLLLRLPEWCVYVAAPLAHGPEVPPELPPRLRGFFAFVDWTAERRPELWLLLEIFFTAGGPPHPVSLPLDRHTLAEALREARERRLDEDDLPELATLQGAERDRRLQFSAEVLREETEHALTALLYLCSREPDVGEPQLRPGRASARPGRIGDEPTFWPVGWRVGRALRAGAPPPAAPREATGAPRGRASARPRPHVRRAHWHTFWLGPRARPDERHPELRWIAPMLVAAAGAEALVATVHPVDADRDEPAQRARR